MKPYIGYRLEVLNRTWSVYFLTKKQFHKLYGTGALAMTETDDREIFLRRDELSQETTIHELFHAYIQEYSAHTLELTTDQMEELCCDIACKHAQELIDKSKELLNAFKIIIGRPKKACIS